MDNVNEDRLSFPQRHWLLLCILVAILSPLMVHSIQRLAHKNNYNEAMEQKPIRGSAGDSSSSNSTIAPGGTDTSYKVAAPPQHK